MDNVVRSVYVKNAKQHPISRRDRGNKSNNSDEQEDETDENCGSFNHFLLRCGSRSNPLMTVAPLEGKKKRPELFTTR